MVFLIIQFEKGYDILKVNEHETPLTVHHRKRPVRSNFTSDTAQQGSCMIIANQRVRETEITHEVRIFKEQPHHFRIPLDGCHKVFA